MTGIQILQIISIIFLLLGLGMLINPKYHRKAFEDLNDNKSNVYLYGSMGLVIGYLLITFKGDTNGWLILLPIFGWLGIIKSILFFLAPEFLMSFTKIFTKRKENLMFIGLFVTIFGAILGYVSFFVL
jgi:uncharacterized protein YjeT (DUF2065 family)